MARIAATLVWIAVALWFGGMMFLFVAVQTLFRAFPRGTSTVALESAPALFGVFEKYQLILASVALVAAFVWYVATRSKRVMTIFILLALAAAAGVASTTMITPKMERLRKSGESSSAEFRQLHGRSMLVYVSQAGVLLVTALMLPAAPTARRTTPAVAPG